MTRNNGYNNNDFVDNLIYIKKKLLILRKVYLHLRKLVNTKCNF